MRPKVLKNNNLPELGTKERGWSGGPDEEMLDGFKIFTRQFPDYTFGFHFFYFDAEALIINYIKDGQIIRTDEQKMKNIFCFHSRRNQNGKRAYSRRYQRKNGL